LERREILEILIKKIHMAVELIHSELYGSGQDGRQLIIPAQASAQVTAPSPALPPRPVLGVKLSQ
jgi:hypothetical protein